MDYLKRRNNLLDKLTEIYIFMIIVIFPLCVDKTGFFRILECKYRIYLGMSVGYIAITIITIIYYYIFHKVNNIKNIKISKVQCAVIAFWIVNVISCIFSDYLKKYNLFVGVGRGEGLINITLYCFTFILISTFGKFRKRYITYFSISSICISSIAILQYIGFNPLNMYQDGIGTHNVSFMATIGNIDFISAMYCILLTVSFSAFIFIDEKIKYKIMHLLSVFMGFFIFIIINVMSGKIAFLAIFIILSPLIVTNSKRLYRAIIVFASIIFGLAINIIINPQYHYNIQKLTLDFQFNKISFVFLIITGIFAFLAYILYRNEYDLSKNKKIIKILYAVIVGSIFLLIICLYFINFSSGTLYEVHELLHGNFIDEFGTYRIFLCKRAMKLFRENPIIGSGPDTFAVRFMDKYTDDVMKIGKLSINDTAGNVYITMLINIGMLGLVVYLIFLILQLKEGIKKKNNYSKVLLIAILCYWIQDLFNLWVVVVTPVYWTLMAIHQLGINENTKDLEIGGIKMSQKKKNSIITSLKMVIFLLIVLLIARIAIIVLGNGKINALEGYLYSIAASATDCDATSADATSCDATGADATSCDATSADATSCDATSSNAMEVNNPNVDVIKNNNENTKKQSNDNAQEIQPKNEKTKNGR